MAAAGVAERAPPAAPRSLPRAPSSCSRAPGTRGAAAEPTPRRDRRAAGNLRWEVCAPQPGRADAAGRRLGPGAARWRSPERGPETRPPGGRGDGGPAGMLRPRVPGAVGSGSSCGPRGPECGTSGPVTPVGKGRLLAVGGGRSAPPGWRGSRSLGHSLSHPETWNAAPPPAG